MYQNIEGPVSLSYQIKDNKKIYIFGDEHLKYSKCKNSIRIDQFLNNLPKDTNKKIDLFVEGLYDNQVNLDFYEEDLTSTENYLNDVLNLAPHDNLEIHYCDVRKYFKGFESLIFFMVNLDLFSKYLNAPDDYFSNAEEKAEKGNVILGDLNYWHNKIKMHINDIETFIFNRRAVQEKINLSEYISKTKYSNELQSIGEQLVMDFSITRKEYIYFMEKYYKPFNIYNIKYHNLIKDNSKELIIFYNNFQSWANIFMDIYLLALLLNEKYENCVIYTGNNHSKLYRKVLEKLGFNTVSYKTSNRQCIKLEDFKQPFFQ